MTTLESMAEIWGPDDVARLLLILSDRLQVIGDFHRRNDHPMDAAQCYAQARRCTQAAQILDARSSILTPDEAAS